jgi:protein-L-isoaspartate(D-aspartate) O-methyltransferase
LHARAERRCGGYNEGVPSDENLLRRLRAAGIHDRRVLEAFATVPREQFVPAQWRDQAFEDVPLPIPHDQVTTQPSLTARMIEGIRLSGNERVLEVGTGCGFQTALPVVLADEVWSVERWPDLAAAAIENLARSGIENARVIVADGSRGLTEHAPFDRVVVATTFPWVPPPLVEQLAKDGRLVQPIGPGGREEVTAFVRADRGLTSEEVLTVANFVPMIGEHGLRE